ncbi:hypothetical protein DL98DRAFT_593336 [Cadophora sp. DSE1049]|nr:hypothetical protein DL98DRAFT_593336 [Cadophora sp. DSE1049]
MISNIVVDENLDARRAEPEDEIAFWKFIENSSKILWNKELMMTEARSQVQYYLGYIGLGPLAAHLGDEVLIVAGSNWPLLLRKVSEETDLFPAMFRCLGKCYVHGIMDGEAAKDIEERATKINLV